MKQLIKYAALLFALILAASIIGGCLTAGVALVRTIVDKSEEAAEDSRANGGNSLWYRDENGDVVFLGIHLGETSGEVKSGVEQFIGADIKEMDINVGSVSLTVEVWDNNYVSVEYENVPVEYYFVTEGEKLIIDREDSFSFLWNVSFTETPKITVNVPASVVYEKVTLDKGSGSGRLLGLAAEEISVDNGSGGLEVSDVSATILRVDSGSGGVNISGCTAEKSVLDSGSGSFVVKNCTLGVTSMKAGSGTVRLEDVVAKNLRLETGSGRAEVSGVLTGKCDFESGSGSLNVVVYGNEEDYNYRVDMGSGSFYYNGKKAEKYSKDDKRAAYLLDFDAGSGRVSLEFKDAPENMQEALPENEVTESGENFER